MVEIALLSRRPDPYFSGPILKIRHADAHIDQLKREIAEFFGRKPYRIRASTDPATNRTEVFTQVLELVPPRWGLLIADIIHNLRSCLDILANDFLFCHGYTDRSYYFPISKDAPTFATCFTGRNPKLPKDLPAPIRERFEAVQPYKRGNGFLREIHDLDIAGKHKFIVPTVIAGAVSNVNATGLGMSISGGTIGIDTGKLGEKLVMSMNSALKFEPNAQLATRVLFGDANPRPIGDITNDAIREIINVLLSFEDNLIASGKIP